MELMEGGLERVILGPVGILKGPCGHYEDHDLEPLLGQKAHSSLKEGYFPLLFYETRSHSVA